MADRPPPSRPGNNSPQRRPFGSRPGGDDRRSGGGPQRPSGPNASRGPQRPSGPNASNGSRVARPAFRPQSDAKPRPQQARKNESVEGEDRLQKVLAQAGLGSRRSCEELISQGRVTINGETAKELGVKVDPAHATIHVDGQKVKVERHVYYAVHKPKGYVASNNDPAGKPLVIDLLSEVPQRVYTVGRLDEQSTGLILLTNDGDLANKLAHPKFGVEKIYRVVVAGLPQWDVLDQLTKGIWLAEGKVRAKRVRIVGQKGQASVLEMVLAEGKNREIRRMLAKLGHKVMSLTRIAVGPVGLKGLGVGEIRPLSARELDLLRQVAAGIPVPSPKFPDRRPRVSRSATESNANDEQQESRPAPRPAGFTPRPPFQGGQRNGEPQGGRPPFRPNAGVTGSRHSNSSNQGRPPFRPNAGDPGNGPRPPYQAGGGRPPFRPNAGGPGQGPRPPFQSEGGRPPFRPNAGGTGNGPRPSYQSDQGDRPPFRPNAGGPGNGPRPPFQADQGGRPPFRPNVGGPGNGPRPPFQADQGGRPPFRPNAGGPGQGPRPPYQSEGGRPPFRPNAGGPGQGPRPPYQSDQEGRPPFRPNAGGPGNGPRPPYQSDQGGRPPFRPNSGGPGNGPRPHQSDQGGRPPFRPNGDGPAQGPRTPSGAPRIYQARPGAGGPPPQGRRPSGPGAVHRSSRPAPAAGSRPMFRSGEDAPSTRRIIGFEGEAGNGGGGSNNAPDSGSGYGGPGGPRLKRPGPKRPPRSASGLKRPPKPGTSDN